MEISFLEFLIYRQNTISNSFSEKDQGHAVLPPPQSLEGTTLEQAFDAGMRWTQNFKAQISGREASTYFAVFTVP